VAAVVLGCQTLDPDVPISGIVLNRVAGSRHESVVRQSVESVCDIPVVGSIGRIKQQLFPERHLGLIPPQEHGQLDDSIEQVRSIVEDSLDLDTLWTLAENTVDIPLDGRTAVGLDQARERTIRVGIFRDAAFQFYYPENLEALEHAGAELIEISPLSDSSLPDVDALYIGGGFPETLAPGLASNRPFLEDVRQTTEGGLPVYAECGGAVFLGEELVYEGKRYPMSGALPVTYGFQERPKGHGYVELETTHANPYYAVGETLRGHEFHYTYILSASSDDMKYAFAVRRGFGFDGQRDGIMRGNVLACYTHVHALGTEGWAEALVAAATRFRLRTKSD
jgi:cobyrinic acid a,c-diamide synthase